MKIQEFHRLLSCQVSLSGTCLMKLDEYYDVYKKYTALIIRELSMIIIYGGRMSAKVCSFREFIST